MPSMDEIWLKPIPSPGGEVGLAVAAAISRAGVGVHGPELISAQVVAAAIAAKSKVAVGAAGEEVGLAVAGTGVGPSVEASIVGDEIMLAFTATEVGAAARVETLQASTNTAISKRQNNSNGFISSPVNRSRKMQRQI
jgi:hypothetical protein